MSEILCVATFDTICTFSFDTKSVHLPMDFQIFYFKKEKSKFNQENKNHWFELLD
jgi:hypothetical protein